VFVEAERAGGKGMECGGAKDADCGGANDAECEGPNDATRAGDGCRDPATGPTGLSGFGAVKLVDPERLAFRGSEAARDAPKRASEVPANEAISAAKIQTRQEIGPGIRVC
jgi:hypothetical protein